MRTTLQSTLKTSFSAPPIFTPVRSGLLQRKCACGGTSGPTGECESCRKKKLQRRQGSLSAPSSIRHPPPSVSEAPPIVHEVLRSPGQPLDAQTRAFMESRFGHDFSRVRVHTDARATESARDVNALAYTVGRGIVFGEGQYMPRNEGGRRLLAHELAHTMQQEAGEGLEAESTKLLEVGDPGSPVEHEAERVAASVLAPLGQRSVTASVQADRGTSLRRQGNEDGGTKGSDPPVDAGKEGGDSAPPSSGANVSVAPCDPKSLSRADYLKEPGTSSNDFGLTTLSGTVSVPAVQTSKTTKGLVLDATAAQLPPLTSVCTGVDTFIESEAIFLGDENSDCPSGKKYPLQWRILPGGAQKIREAELEHCADFQYAFAISLQRYADVVNDLAAKKRVFSSQKAAEKHVTQLVGPEPNTWPAVFTCLAKKTKNRDRSWHIPHPLRRPPRLDDDCKFARVIVSESSLPEVGQGQHPTPDVIKDCGEGPPVKAKAGGRPAVGQTKSQPAPKVEAKSPRSIESMAEHFT